MYKRQGFNNYLWGIGVGWFNRQFARGLTPIETITPGKDGSITLATVTSLASGTITFRPDQPVDWTTMDGRKVTVTATLDIPNQEMTIDEVGREGHRSSRKVMKFSEDGATMVLTLSEPQYGYTSTRTYARL